MRKLKTVAVGLVSLLSAVFGANVSAAEAANERLVSIKLDVSSSPLASRGKCEERAGQHHRRHG